MNQSVHEGCLTMYDGSDRESLNTQFKMFQFSTDNKKTATKLVECFCQVPDLVECCKLLVNAGHLKQVLMGAKWFIEPSLVNPIVRILENNGVQMNGLFKGKWRTIKKKRPRTQMGRNHMQRKIRRVCVASFDAI